MSKRMILMRHAASPQAVKGRDFDRPLSMEGKQQAAAIGKVLAEKDWLPDVILVSRARRTQQTAALLLEAAGLGDERILPLEGMYNANPDQLERSIQMAGIKEDVTTILVLAHNPGISHFAMKCIGQARTLYFSPAAVAGFMIDDAVEWDNMTGQAASFVFYEEP